jgi:homoserine kinase type II
MSVYTPVAPEELDAWLARYTVGTLVDLAPIAAGIENTNYPSRRRRVDTC